MLNRPLPTLLVSLACLLAASASAAQMAPPVKLLEPGGDIPAKFEVPTPNRDYVVREAMVPMRDGVKLHTVIVMAKVAANAPILLTRTPYNASARAKRSDSDPDGQPVARSGRAVRQGWLHSRLSGHSR